MWFYLLLCFYWIVSVCFGAFFWLICEIRVNYCLFLREGGSDLMSPDMSLISTISGFYAILYFKIVFKKITEQILRFSLLRWAFLFFNISFLTIIQTSHSYAKHKPAVITCWSLQWKQTHFNLQHSSMEVQTGDFQTDFLFLGVWWGRARSFCPDGARRNQTTASVTLHLLHPLVENLILCGEVKKKVV